MFFSKNAPEGFEEKKRKTDDQLRAEGLRIAIPYPYYIRDMDFNVVEFSPMMEKLTGFDSKQALTMKL